MIVIIGIIYVCLSFYAGYKIGYVNGNHEGWMTGFDEHCKLTDKYFEHRLLVKSDSLPLHKNAELPKIYPRRDDLQS